MIIIVFFFWLTLIHVIRLRFNRNCTILRNLSILGLTIFFIPSFLPLTGSLLSWLEFPAYNFTKTLRSSFNSTTKTIKTPNSQYFSIIGNLARVQRYNAEGEFETGWFVGMGGNSFRLNYTHRGNIAVWSVKRSRFTTYTPDGKRLNKEGMKLIQVEEVPSLKPSLIGWLLMPFFQDPSWGIIISVLSSLWANFQGNCRPTEEEVQNSLYRYFNPKK